MSITHDKKCSRFVSHNNLLRHTSQFHIVRTRDFLSFTWREIQYVQCTTTYP